MLPAYLQPLNKKAQQLVHKPLCVLKQMMNVACSMRADDFAVWHRRK